MDIRKKFLKLTKRTYPYGTENQLISFLPSGYFTDKHGNYYYEIGQARTAFTCHLDTACKTQVTVNHRIEKNIVSTDGTSILGADDKAGMTVMMYMIEKRIPGLYCFFVGEEVGCIGSGKASDDDYFLNYDRMISFDRRGTKSIITYQSSKRCCSDDFAKELANRLNRYGMSMEPDDTGVYTDSAEFISVIPECTNISVGYYKEHTILEHQDIDHLIKLCIAVTKIDWETLPVTRDPKKIEYKSYSYNKNYGNYSYDRNWDNYSYRDTWGSSKKTRRSSKKNYGYYDDFYFEDEEKYLPVRGVPSTGKSYLNDLDNDITEQYNARNTESNESFHYDYLKQKLYADYFSMEESQKLKEQYIIPSGDYDESFIEDFLQNDAFPF